MSNYAEYKSRRKNVTNVIEKLNQSNSIQKKDYSDPRFYAWKADEQGNATITLRFLPSCNELPPIVSRFRHNFQNNGKYYIENCPTSINLQCPACSSNSALCESGNKEAATGRFRRKEFISNVLIISDKLNPENNGKTFL